MAARCERACGAPEREHSAGDDLADKRSERSASGATSTARHECAVEDQQLCDMPRARTDGDGQENRHVHELGQHGLRGQKVQDHVTPAGELQHAPQRHVSPRQA